MTDDEAITRVREWLHSPWTDTHSPDREWQERIARLGIGGAYRESPQPTDPGPVVYDPPLTQAEGDAYWAAISDDTNPL